FNFQLKNELVSPGENADEIEPEKLSDIISLYESYQNLLGEKYLDYPELLIQTNKIIESDTNILNWLFTSQSFILLDGFSEFKQPEITFISFFAESKVPFAIVIDYSTRSGPLGATLENTILSLTSKGFRLVSTEKDDEQLEPQNQNRKYFISRWLFTPETKVKGPDFKDIITIFAADSRLDEVVSISKLVKYLILKKKCTPGDICICTRKPDNYSELFREIFSLYNIPVNISDRYPLDRSPVAVSVFSLLDIVTRGFRRDDIHRAVLSPYLSYLRNSDENEKSIDGDNLFSVAINLRITGGTRRGGAKFWETRLKSYIDALNIKIDKLKKINSTDPMEIERDLSELRNIKKAYSDFVTLQKLLPKSSGKYLPSEFEDIVKEKILKIFNVKDNILKLYDFVKSSKDLSSIERTNLLEEVERDGRAFSTLINILSEFTFIYEERFPEKKFSLDELVSRFKTMVTSAKYQIREKHNYGVTVTSIEQTRGIPYKVMFLCGALDGEFPLSYQTDIFLGKELPESEVKHFLSERMQFFQFLINDSERLNNGNKKIFITYPKYNEGEELVKSPFIDSI
ncbi:MAG: exodeoxyribonuclease V subunit gamma, partial [Bacteroidetes bacterium]|nr:exodeoxyribonuclease V subunit gamma [Bacteroidota bacterium]